MKTIKTLTVTSAILCGLALTASSPANAAPAGYNPADYAYYNCSQVSTYLGRADSDPFNAHFDIVVAKPRPMLSAPVGGATSLSPAAQILDKCKADIAQRCAAGGVKAPLYAMLTGNLTTSTQQITCRGISAVAQ